MVPLAGSAAGSLAVGAAARPGVPNRSWLLAGAAAGLVPTAITAAYHVPRNNALAQVRLQAPDAAGRWAWFATGWSRWNHHWIAWPRLRPVLAERSTSDEDRGMVRQPVS